MAYGIGLRALHRLCQEQSPLAWQKARLSVDLFKAHEQPCFEWVENHLTQHHALPHIDTLHLAFPETNTETPEPSSYYVKQLENQFFYKQINDANIASQLILKNNPEDHDLAYKGIKQALNVITQQKYRMRIMDVGKEGPQTLLLAYNQKGLIENVSVFGWPYLDEQSGGGMPGDVISYVGRPAIGKTWLCVYTSICNWLQGRNVLLVSMEMQPLSIVQRIASIYTHTNIGQLKTSGFSKSTYDKFVLKLEGISKEKGKLYIVDGNLAANVDDIYTMADQLNCLTIVIDGAYMVRHKNSKLDRYTRVAENVELMKRNSADLGIATFASWQLNREATKKSTQTGKTETNLEDIGYSDAIGQISSIVVGMLQEDGVETMVKRDIRVIKGRNGETGQFSVAWDFQMMDFSQVLPLLSTESKVNKEFQWM